MARQIFINLPVKNLNRSVTFFSALGFTFNKQFTDDKAACMVISQNIYALLITEPYFKTFTKKALCDAHKHTEVLIALDASSRTEVDELVRKAVKAGGSTYMPAQDHGWMYGHSFADPDGHQWEILFMDENELVKK